MSEQAHSLLSKRDVTREFFDETGSEILQHVQAKGNQDQLSLHLKCLKRFFEKSSSLHEQATSNTNSQKGMKRKNEWLAQLSADYSRYNDAANAYLESLREVVAPGMELDPVTVDPAPVPSFANPPSSPQVILGDVTGQVRRTESTPMLRQSLLSRKRADSWISLQDQPTVRHLGLPGRLPKMEVPKFLGDPMEWLNFAAAFNTLVHQNSDDNAYRMAMLQQSLSPSVRKSIAMYLTDPDSYLTALSELREIYGNPLLVAEAHLEGLHTLTAVPDNNPIALRDFSYNLNAILSGLMNDEFHHDLSASSTLSMLANKLPSRLRSKWTKTVIKLRDQQVRPNIEHFVECVKKMSNFEIQNSRTKIWPARDSSFSLPEGKRPRLDAGKTTKANAYAIGVSSFSSLVQCLACDEQHDSSSCDLYTGLSLDERLSKIREKHACYRCLDRSHRCRDCPKKDLCEVEGCKKAHHSSIHGCGRIFQNAKPKVSSSHQA